MSGGDRIYDQREQIGPGNKAARTPEARRRLDELEQRREQSGSLVQTGNRPGAPGQERSGGVTSSDARRWQDGQDRPRGAEKPRSLGDRIVAAADDLWRNGIRGKPLREDPTMTLQEYQALGTRRFSHHRGRNTSEGLTELRKEVGRNVENWCGAFVHVSCRRAGVSDTGFLNSLFRAESALTYAKQHGEQVGMLDLRGKDVAARKDVLFREGAIRPGDIAVFVDKRGRARHLGIVVAFSTQSGVLSTVEGNTWGSDGTSQVMRKKHRLYEEEGKRDVVFLRYKAPTASGERPSRDSRLDQREHGAHARRPRVGESSKERRLSELEKRQPENTGPRPSRGTPASLYGEAYRRESVGDSQPRDAGPAAGAMYPREALGQFHDAVTVDKVADILRKQGELGADPRSQIRKRGTQEDLLAERGRLQDLLGQFDAWTTNNRGLAGNDRRLSELRANVVSSISRLETYIQERRPTDGLEGEADASVLFDGRQLLVHGGRPGWADEAFVASSGIGRLNSVHDTSSKAQQQMGRGPIPEGTYWLDLRQITPVRNPLDWAAWGTKRLTIHPFETTHTFGRGGFFVHGGSEAGSAGCIDLPGHVGDFLDALNDRVPKETLRVRLVVDYSPSKARWAREK